VTEGFSLKPATLADQLLAANIFAELLAATNPIQLGQTLTEQLRVLTGARTVMLVAHQEATWIHEPIHTCPQRRSTLFSSAELRHLCPDCSAERLPHRTEELAAEHPLRALLKRAGVGSLLRFSLRVGGAPVASLLLLDLLSIDRIDETASTITHLLPVMALALRNALALDRIERQAKELDRRVAERTAELEAANQSLAVASLEAVKMMREAIELRQRAEQTTAELRREVQERMRFEQELRQFKTIFDTANFGAAIGNLHDSLTYVNQCFAAAHGFQVEELLGQPLSLIHTEEQLTELSRLHQVLMREGRFNAQEVGHRHRDGTVFPMLMTGMLVRDGAGVAQHVVITAIDLRERKILESQLQQAQKMESVGRLAGGVAHDFNNMLGVILGYVDLALDELDQSQPLYVSLMEIRKAAARSAELTKQLLAFARKQTIAPKVLDLNETVTGMLKMLKRLIGEDINLDWRPGTELWPVKVDPSQIDQILANLCVNARAAIPGTGTIVIETGNRTIKEESTVKCAFVGDFVLLVVSDSGSGMDQETLCHLFEPFFTTKSVGQGTGLGLATVYGSVQQNGGFIDVYSEPGKGSVFSIHLPRYEGKPGRRPAESMPLAVQGGHESILLVEDELAILRLTARLLERQGYAVLAANTPGQAIQMAREHAGDIHLLMTDVVMPEMNGRDLAKSMLSLYPNIKRLFMSGYTADVIAYHGVLEEGTHFIQKPFSSRELAAKVREVLDKK
jgi:PAS domain S-box-containing protein